jgi:hypothetical protein
MTRTEVEEIARFLEENLLPFTPEVVREVARERVGEGLEEVVRGVLEEGRRRTLRVYDRVWELLELPPLPEAREFIERGGEVRVSYLGPRGSAEGPKVEVVLLGKTKPGDAPLLPTPVRPIEGWDLYFETGRVEVRTDSKLLVKGSWAFFNAPSPEVLERTRRTAAFLRPALSEMGIPDLEEALDTLGTLSVGEVRVEGGYLLARGRGFWFLSRKSVLGDPKLDEALLTGREVVLTFPEDVEIAFRLELSRDWVYHGEMRLSQVRLRWGEEVAAFDEAVVFHESVLSREALAGVLKRRLDLELRYLEAGKRRSPEEISPRMSLFMRAFVEHEDPLGALEKGRFSPHTVAQMFLDM